MWEKFKFSKILFLLWHTKIPIEHKKEKKKRKKKKNIDNWKLKFVWKHKSYLDTQIKKLQLGWFYSNLN